MLWRNRLVVPTIALSLIALLALPLLFNTASPICPLSASAQDNPCLAQDATISAMQLQMVNMQGTITALESQLQPTSASSLPFREDFNTNERGWDIVGRTDGSAAITNQKLNLSVAANSSFVLLVPELTIPEDFYAEVEVDGNVSVGNNIGFWVGDYASNQYHLFLMNGYYLTFRDKNVDIFKIDLRGANKMTLAIEALQGVITFYLDGVPYSPTAITPYGNQIGLYAENGFQGTLDTLIIREYR
jgi:hypothetical protein